MLEGVLFRGLSSLIAEQGGTRAEGQQCPARCSIQFGGFAHNLVSFGFGAVKPLPEPRLQAGLRKPKENSKYDKNLRRAFIS